MKQELNLTALIKDNTVEFSHYRAGYLYYNIRNPQDHRLYCFPVPIEDVGDATFLAQDKAMMMMRYIRKAMSDNTLVVAHEDLGLNEDIKDDDDHMTLEHFQELVECGGFIDYDGYGVYASENKKSNKTVVPSDLENGGFDKRYSHVVWYNR